MKTVLALVSIVLSILSCEAALAPECSWGPSYWCQSKVTASQCGQETYCSNQVWKAEVEVESIVGSVQCDVCKLVVGYVQKFVENNSTESEAEAAVEKLCSALGSLKDECNTLVTTFFPQIWQLVVNKVDPNTVCTEIKLCSSAQHAEVKAMEVKSVQCDVCKIVAQYLQQFAEKNVTEAEVQQELEKLCTILGSLKDECDTLLTGFFPQLWDAIVKKLDPSTVCTQIKLCTSQITKQAKLPSQSVVKVDGCDICKKVVEALQSLLLSNTTEEVAEKEVKRVCFFLGPLDGQCKTMIDTYFPQMWKLLQEELSPDQVCDVLKLCNSTSMKAVPKAVKTAECDVCKIIALYLNKFVASNGTETEAKDEVKKLCSLLGSVSSECSSVVDMFFDQIWKLVVAETEPDAICDMLKLCTSTALKVPKRKVSMPKQNLCDICKLAVSFLKPYVDSNSTENEVKQALEQLCNILPSSYKTQCTDLINQNFDTIWDLVKSEVDNDLICKQIGVCNSTLSMLKFHISKPRLSLPKQGACDVCKLAVTFLQQYVDSNSTETEVKQALEKLCDILPSGFKDECTNLIDQNFGTIWLLVKSEFDNDLICKQIGLCNSTLAQATRGTTVATSRAKPKPAMPKQTLCDMCKLAVTFLKPYVDSNSTEKEVEDALDEVCNLLPGNYSKQCGTLLDTFFPSIWDMLKNEVDSNEICTALKLCNSTSTKTKSVAVSRPKTESGPLCTVCKLVSAFIRQFVDNKSTKSDAEKAVSELCNKLPSPYNSTCSTLVDTYFDMIWNLIDSYVDDDDLCKQLNLCNDSVTLELKQDASGPLCILCEFVMKELESMLNSNTTEAEIRAALDKVCSLLPSSIKTDCDEFVDKYGDDIIKLLLEAVSPRVVCTALHLCLTSQKVVVMPVVEERVGLKDECSTCKMVLGFVKTLVEDYQKPIEDALEDVCNLMPSAIRSECTEFVKEFSPALIQLVDKEIDPDTLCKDLKVCSSQKESALVAPWKKLARAKSF